MENVQQKRRRGRPATGQTPTLALRLSAEELEAIDQFAAEQKITRSKALRVLLREGFAACLRGGKREALTRKRQEETFDAKLVEQTMAEAAVQDEPQPLIMSTRKLGHRRNLTLEEIRAAVDPAEQRRR
jgi:hypothetical protein